MMEEDKLAISRRAVLKAASVGAGVAIGGLLSVSSATAATASLGAPANEQGPPLEGFTDVNGALAEYREAVARFDLPLPSGWSFPDTFGASGLDSSAVWEKGIGKAEAFFSWQRAVATAAHDAHNRRDSAEADRLLSLLETAQQSSTRRSLVGRHDEKFIPLVIQPARTNAAARGATGGDFSRLMEAVRSA